MRITDRCMCLYFFGTKINIAPIEILYTLKSACIRFPIHWEKNIEDYFYNINHALCLFLRMNTTLVPALLPLSTNTNTKNTNTNTNTTTNTNTSTLQELEMSIRHIISTRCAYQFLQDLLYSTREGGKLTHRLSLLHDCCSGSGHNMECPIFMELFQ